MIMIIMVIIIVNKITLTIFAGSFRVTTTIKVVTTRSLEIHQPIK